MGGAVKAVVNVVDKAVTTIGKTVESVVKNPLPVIESVALMSVGVPPAIAGAIVSAANGGTPEQIVKAAAFSSIPAAGNAIAASTGMSVAASTALASAAVSVATGSSIEQAIVNGTISAAVSGSAPYVKAQISELVSSPAVTQALTNATLAAEGTVLHGGNSDQIAKSIANSFANSAITETAKALAPSTIMPTTNPDRFNAAKDSLAASNALTPAETLGATPLAPSETLGATPLDASNEIVSEPVTSSLESVATNSVPPSSGAVENTPLNALSIAPTSSIDATSAPINEPHPATLPLTLPEETTSPLDTSVDANYSLNSTLTPKLGVDPTTGTGLTIKPETLGASDVGYSPVDYALTDPSGLSDGIGLQMPTSSNIKSMGGGQGLTADVTNPVTGETGTVGELGYTATGAIPVSDPAYNTTTPKATTSSGSSSNLSNLLLGLPLSTFAKSAGTTSTSSPLDAAKVAESYLTTKTVNGQQLTLPQLKQLYPEVVPELSKLLIERGMTLNPAPQEVKFGDYPQTAPSNSSSGELNPVSFANFGQPSEDFQYAAKGGSMKLPKGHHPEFITGQTGHYAQGRGTGQSDDIPAVLHDGDYVVDADTVAAFGDGSSKAGAGALEQFRKSIPEHHSGGGQPIPAQIADGEYVLPAGFVTTLGQGSNKQGAKMLDAMREQIRAHKRSAPDTKIPPKAKSPLQYMREAMKG